MSTNEQNNIKFQTVSPTNRHDTREHIECGVGSPTVRRYVLHTMNEATGAGRFLVEDPLMLNMFLLYKFLWSSLTSLK